MTTSSSGSGGDDRSPEHRPEGPPGGSDSADGQRFVLHKPGGEPVRTGRNLPLAIASGCVLGALVFFSVFPWPQLFTIITSLAVLIGLREVNRAFAGKGMTLAVVPLAVGGVAMQAFAYFGGADWLAGATALTAIAVLSWRLRGGAEGFVSDAAANLFTLVYLPFLLGTWMLLIAHPEDGQYRLVTFIVVTISSDIGGYFAGILLGRHKMAPVISPNKTWEGFGGSVVGCCVAGALCVVLMLDGPWWVGVVLGLAVVLGATVGDLIESMFKRDLGVKDMGRFMPGHGGLMDRLDSLLIAGPVVWIVLSLLL
ncbi:phosphatidate cytidylyltransferase [Nocardiopsis sp. Huas11]|uniref:phosphatidate cytidylyltransferase n=1 Tax=Nocardiopsis sp. Huas11 TaxID=2183912 RepID=UPI000EB3DAC0|nr:phosphatidate cytidylyltransferase [Nocardiopsis sp. Huas11]RKS10675.1 phosphatidate cytidylyltransferase [Nocardiopsis sp. Huas11]